MTDTGTPTGQAPEGAEATLETSRKGPFFVSATQHCAPQRAEIRVVRMQNIDRITRRLEAHFDLALTDLKTALLRQLFLQCVATVVIVWAVARL